MNYLIKLADLLDSRGLYAEADLVDRLLIKALDGSVEQRLAEVGKYISGSGFWFASFVKETQRPDFKLTDEYILPLKEHAQQLFEKQKELGVIINEVKEYIQKLSSGQRS